MQDKVNRHKTTEPKQIIESQMGLLQQLFANGPARDRKRIVLVSCSSKKANCPAGTQKPAKELYTGALFTKSWALAERCHADAIYILSAKHHLLHPDTHIAPYNVTLNRASAAQRRRWSEEVLKQLRNRGFDLNHDEFVFLAGRNYYKDLISTDGIPCENALTPFADYKGIGYILQALTHILSLHGTVSTY